MVFEAIFTPTVIAMRKGWFLVKMANSIPANTAQNQTTNLTSSNLVGITDGLMFLVIKTIKIMNIAIGPLPQLVVHYHLTIMLVELERPP